jgi:hypothetical protein
MFVTLFAILICHVFISTYIFVRENYARGRFRLLEIGSSSRALLRDGASTAMGVGRFRLAEIGVVRGGRGTGRWIFL